MKYKKYFLIIFLLIYQHTVFADPDIKEEFSYYYIYPDSPSEIASELSKNSPIRENGKIFRGHTEWNVNWNYWWNKNDSACNVENVETEVVIKYTMPKLSMNNENKAIEEKFNTYYSALMLHEEGHKESAINAAREIENTLLNIPGRKDCEELENIANNKANNIIRKYKKKDIVYDYKTDHGRTQGAVIE